MADAREHGSVVLAAVLPRRRDLLEKMLRRLTAEHFTDRVQSNLFTILQKYFDITQSVLTASALEDALRSSDPGQVQLYVETFRSLEAKQVEDGEFSWSIDQLKELASDKATIEALTEGMEILRTGKTLTNGETVKGNKEARDRVIELFANVEKDLSMQDAPEGDLREERIEIMQDYADRKRARETGTAQGILFGIEGFDTLINGVQPGDLILSAGYSNDGKTTLCTQMAWSAAVEQGKNVVFFTTETSRDTVRRKLVSRHSKQQLFGLPDGINSADLKSGSLPEAMEPKLAEVVADLTKNPTYGKLYVAQVPRHATVASLEQRLYRLQRSFNIDLVVCDYLALLKSDRRRNDDRQELSGIIKEAKQLATTFDDGRGIPFISPWQVNRSAREEAEKNGHYTSKALAETAEATNSADIIISILAPTDNTNRHAELKGQILKARDGPTASGLLLDVDYATSSFKSKVGFASIPSAPGYGGVVGGLDLLNG